MAEERLDEIAALSRSLAERAGDILLDRFQSALDVDFKDEHAHDPVTEVDRAVEDMVRAEVSARFPEHGILGEERDDGGPQDANVVWVIDPLDGTSNFINGLGIFACSIGVLDRGAPIAGAVWVSTSRRLEPGVYHASQDSGLHWNGEPDGELDSDLPASSRLSGVPGGTGGVTGPAGRRFGVVRTLGSIAAELTFAAEGSLQMTIIEGAKIWDVAGAIALCQAADRAIFTRPKHGRDWRPLQRFGEHLPGPVDSQQLRNWSDALAAGDATLLPSSASDLSKEQGIRPAVKRAATRQIRRVLHRPGG